jgi:hypothetical protein
MHEKRSVSDPLFQAQLRVRETKRAHWAQLRALAADLDASQQAYDRVSEPIESMAKTLQSKEMEVAGRRKWVAQVDGNYLRRPPPCWWTGPSRS